MQGSRCSLYMCWYITLINPSQTCLILWKVCPEWIVVFTSIHYSSAPYQMRWLPLCCPHRNHGLKHTGAPKKTDSDFAAGNDLHSWSIPEIIAYWMHINAHYPPQNSNPRLPTSKMLVFDIHNPWWLQNKTRGTFQLVKPVAKIHGAEKHVTCVCSCMCLVSFNR
jgi:hypothetical protein